jgi:hypothetical protein
MAKHLQIEDKERVDWLMAIQETGNAPLFLEDQNLRKGKCR